MVTSRKCDASGVVAATGSPGVGRTPPDGGTRRGVDGPRAARAPTRKRALRCPIALQTGGTATFVAGFRAWLNLGYAVDRGQKAIRILAPMPVKQRDEQPADTLGEEREESRRVLYRWVAMVGC